jgi:hypothetical protein
MPCSGGPWHDGAGTGIDQGRAALKKELLKGRQLPTSTTFLLDGKWYPLWSWTNREPPEYHCLIILHHMGVVPLSVVYLSIILAPARVLS